MRSTGTASGDTRANFPDALQSEGAHHRIQHHARLLRRSPMSVSHKYREHGLCQPSVRASLSRPNPKRAYITVPHRSTRHSRRPTARSVPVQQTDSRTQSIAATRLRSSGSLGPHLCAYLVRDEAALFEQRPAHPVTIPIAAISKDAAVPQEALPLTVARRRAL